MAGTSRRVGPVLAAVVVVIIMGEDEAEATKGDPRGGDNVGWLGDMRGEAIAEEEAEV